MAGREQEMAIRFFSKAEQKHIAGGSFTRNPGERFAGTRILVRRALRSLAVDEKGVTAIEFAMVAPVFFGLLLMIIESGIVFAAAQMFDASVANASRQILIGSMQSQLASGSTDAAVKQQFRDLICQGMSPMIAPATCQSVLLVDMKRFPVNVGVQPSALALPLNGSQLDQTKMTCANFGDPNEYMLVRGYYQYPVYVAYLGGGAGATNSGSRLLIGSSAFKLEPYGGTGSARNGSGVPTYNTCP